MTGPMLWNMSTADLEKLLAISEQDLHNVLLLFIIKINFIA